jgi:hypothetical protein
VERSVVEEKRSIALSFEGRRNPDPRRLSKIQKGMFKFSSSYNIPCLLFRLKGIEKVRIIKLLEEIRPDEVTIINRG